MEESIGTLKGPTDEVLIVGAGIGGLAAAIALRQVGIGATIFEQAPVLEEVGAGVSLWPNATRVLRRLGLFEAVAEGHEPMAEIVVRRVHGPVLLRLEGVGGWEAPAICVHRAHLQRVLVEHVPAHRLHLGRRLVRIERGGGLVRGVFEDGSSASGTLLLGCDGIHSIVRGLLHGSSPAHYRGYQIWRGVSHVPLDESFLGRSTEWWGPGKRFGLLPGGPERLFWYATHTRRDDGIPSEPQLPLLRELFGGWPDPVMEIMEGSPGGRVIRTQATDRSVAYGRGRITLLGDAAHPMTPNLGQGACTTLEDALALARVLSDEGLTPNALRRYEGIRRPRTRGIVRQSRRIGEVAQLSHPLLTRPRDRLMQVLPGSMVKRAERGIYGYGYSREPHRSGS